GLPPEVRTLGGVSVAYPTDPDAGGTWIAANDAGVTLAILNAREPEGRALPRHPRSRGLVLLDLASARSIAEVVERVGAIVPSFQEVRSFHLAVAQPGDADHRSRISRFLWNGIE